MTRDKLIQEAKDWVKSTDGDKFMLQSELKARFIIQNFLELLQSEELTTILESKNRVMELVDRLKQNGHSCVLSMSERHEVEDFVYDVYALVEEVYSSPEETNEL